MAEKVYSLKISELDPSAPALGIRGRAVSKACLHYNAPSSGGWGITRIAMLVPESVMLFVAPHGCGRHGSIAAVQMGYGDRIFYLDVSESDLVIGSHLDRIDQMVQYLLDRLPQKPKAFLICASCIDDLLASDYRSITRRLSRKHGIPFGEFHMNPITTDSSTPPPLNVQRSIYRFLWENKSPRCPQKDINLIGHFSPVNSGSELYPVLQEAGFANIRQISAMNTFEEFLEMRNSSYNIMLKPFGRLACDEMQKHLEIPYTRQYIRYRAEGVAETYHTLGDFLGCELNYLSYYQACLEKIEAHKSSLKGLRIAVGDQINGSNFELACALTEYGAEIAFLISGAVADYEWEYVERLQKYNPDIPVYTSFHPTMSVIESVGEKADLAIGFDASYYSRCNKLLLLDSDHQHFGFEAVASLLDEIDRAMEREISPRDLLYSKALVV